MFFFCLGLVLFGLVEVFVHLLNITLGLLSVIPVFYYTPGQNVGLDKFIRHLFQLKQTDITCK